MIKKRIEISLTDEQWEHANQMFKSYNDTLHGFGLTGVNRTDANIVNYLISHALNSDKYDDIQFTTQSPKIHNERCAGRKRLSITLEQVQALWDAGMTAKQIADELNTSIATVKRIRHPNLRK